MSILSVIVFNITAYTFWLWPFVFLYGLLKLRQFPPKERKSKSFLCWFFITGAALFLVSMIPDTIAMYDGRW